MNDAVLQMQPDESQVLERDLLVGSSKAGSMQAIMGQATSGEARDTTTAVCHLSRLPVELIFLVFQFLCMSDLKNLRLNKYFGSAILPHIFRHILCKDDRKRELSAFGDLITLATQSTPGSVEEICLWLDNGDARFQVPSEAEWNRVSEPFVKLKKLAITMEGFRKQTHKEVIRHINRLVKNTRQITALSLNFELASGVFVGCMLNVKSPRLKHLTISDAVVTERQLLEYVSSHKSTLKTLNFTGVQLLRGNWVGVLPKIASDCDLSRCQFSPYLGARGAYRGFRLAFGTAHRPLHGGKVVDDDDRDMIWEAPQAATDTDD